MKIGEHRIKTWSLNQSVIALSPREAAFYGIVKGASNALGICGVLRDFAINQSVAVNTDSSAAKGIANRRGLGKIRHIELGELLIQEQVARGRIVVYKFSGQENAETELPKHFIFATKFLQKEDMQSCLWHDVLQPSSLRCT